MRTLLSVVVVVSALVFLLATLVDTERRTPQRIRSRLDCMDNDFKKRHKLDFAVKDITITAFLVNGIIVLGGEDEDQRRDAQQRLAHAAAAPQPPQ